MILLDEKDVDAVVTVPLGLAAAEASARAVADGALSTGRVEIGDDLAWSRILAGLLPGLDLLGYKEFHRVGQHVRYHVNLFRRSTGEAVAVVDGRRITSLRTACTAACAARRFFGARPVRLGVIGSGEEAREGLRALAGALELSAVAVWSPTPANRETYARDMTVELGLDVRPSGTPGEVLAGRDMAYVATSATAQPFLTAPDVVHLRFLAAIGSTRPYQRELRGDVLARAARVIVDCPDALHEPGDVIEAVRDHGWDTAGALLLGEYLAGAVTEATEATGPDGPTVFKSIGSVEQDLVLAHHIVEEARRTGRGRTVDPVGSLRVMR